MQIVALSTTLDTIVESNNIDVFNTDFRNWYDNIAARVLLIVLNELTPTHFSLLFLEKLQSNTITDVSHDMNRKSLKLQLLFQKITFFKF